MSYDTSSVPDGRRAPRDRVADALRDRIHSGSLRPGCRLPTQQELVAEFSVGRTAVRDALRTLADEGLLTGTGRGSPPTVADRPPAHEHPRVAGVEHADRVQHAFRADHVTIDAFSLTTETLHNSVAHVLAVSGAEQAPHSITVRVMLPCPQAQLAVPQLVGDPQDKRPLTRLRALTRAYSDALQLSLRALQERSLVPEVSVEVRNVAITPTHKLYVLNGNEALLGLYRVVPRTVEHEGTAMEIYDVLGLESPLFRFSSGDAHSDEQGAAFVEQSRLWFESLWSTIAVPVKLG